MTNAIVKVGDSLPAVPQFTMDETERIAKIIAASNMFGVKNPIEALALCLVAQAQGLHPAMAALEFHVIKGKPARTAESMLARFQQAGGKVEWVELTNTRACAKFSHPSGGTVEIDWDMDRAKAAGLTGKDNWHNFPRAMLRARVVSEGVRTVYPGVTLGVYTVEEVQDFADEPVEGNAYPSPIVTREPHVQAQSFMVESGELAKTKESTPRPFIRWNVRFDDGQTDKVIYYGLEKARLTLGHDPVQYRGRMQATLTQLPKGGYRAEDVSFLDINALEGPLDAEFTPADEPQEQGDNGGAPAGKAGLAERIARESERSAQGSDASN